MRFMMIVKGDRVTESGALPTAKDIAVMGQYNEELMRAGAWVDAAGLHPTSKGAKATYQNGRVVVTDGPFAETKEIIAGYWIINVASKADAIAWAERIPFDHIPGNGRVPEVEIRQLYDEADFR